MQQPYDFVQQPPWKAALRAGCTCRTLCPENAPRSSFGRRRWLSDATDGRGGALSASPRTRPLPYAHYGASPAWSSRARLRPAGLGAGTGGSEVDVAAGSITTAVWRGSRTGVGGEAVMAATREGDTWQ